MSYRMGVLIFLSIFSVFAISMASIGLGYQLGKATPCVDEEQFDIRPLPRR